MNYTKLTQYTHRPNMTELGMGNTHETYMLISKDTDLSSIFPPNQEVRVKDMASGKEYRLRSTGGSEFRVNQMGELYRDYKVRPGDEIVITLLENKNASSLTVAVRKFQRVVLLVDAKGSEVVNIDRLKSHIIDDSSYGVNIYDRGNLQNLKISFKELRKKRKDSPNETEFYYTKINGKDLPNGTYYLTLGDNPSLAMLPKSEFNAVYFNESIFQSLNDSKKIQNENVQICPVYRPYITAIKSKPFLLLAGLSGTGKSRIVRELARACWDESSEEYLAQKPRNFEMVQVKPNWHDSSDLLGYVSRVSGDPIFIAGDFLKFVARAWEEPDVPYFLCLDEMNLAPVEQYFAEYLSVVESRKADSEGVITTDPILEKNKDDWYRVLTSELTDNNDVRERFLQDGICLPQNLIVVGTVNMDETTFSFSRKVLDRAMTIEMNEVDLNGGLSSRYEPIGKLDTEQLIGHTVEGVDVYETNQVVCDTAISYLQCINDKLEGTPFKVAYRTRNEVLLYVLNNLPYNKDENGAVLTQAYVIARALDEITNMKILSRIEGDESKVSRKFLEELENTIKNNLESISSEPFTKEDSDEAYKSVSLAKLDEMKKRLSSGYTSFWS